MSDFTYLCRKCFGPKTADQSCYHEDQWANLQWDNLRNKVIKWLEDSKVRKVVYYKTAWLSWKFLWFFLHREAKSFKCSRQIWRVSGWNDWNCPDINSVFNTSQIHLLGKRLKGRHFWEKPTWSQAESLLESMWQTLKLSGENETKVAWK